MKNSNEYFLVLAGGIAILAMLALGAVFLINQNNKVTNQNDDAEVSFNNIDKDLTNIDQQNVSIDNAINDKATDLSF